MARYLAIILPCSLALGVFFGLVSAVITRHSHMRLRRRPHVELALLLTCALAAYAFTDWVTIGGAQQSAILASFFSGITMRHYTFYNLSHRAQRSAVVMFRTLSSLCEVGKPPCPPAPRQPSLHPPCPPAHATIPAVPRHAKPPRPYCRRSRAG